MKTLYIDVRPKPGAYTLLEFSGAHRSVVAECASMRAALDVSKEWNENQVKLCEPCQIVFVNEDGDETELKCAQTVSVPIGGCGLTTAQVEHLVEEYFGRIHDGTAHFAHRVYAESFAETIGAQVS